MKEGITELEELASKMIGDGKTPDVFFVSEQGKINLVTTDFELAYYRWQVLSRGCRMECALENRTYGTICAVEPEDSELVDRGYPKFDRFDHSEEFHQQNTCKPV